MANFEENVEEIIGTREAAGGERVRWDETGNEIGGPGGAGGLEDETSDKTVATAGDERYGGDWWGNVCGRRSAYNRRPPSLFGEHCVILRWRTLRKTLRRWWGRLQNGEWRQSPAGTRPGTRPAFPGTRPATRRRQRLVTNETAATGGVMYTDEGVLEFDEDEMAALEGQCLVVEFRCGIY